MDPVSVLAIGANVVQILGGFSSPITAAIKARRVKKKVAAIIDRVTSEFVRDHPDLLAVWKYSAEPIARELADLRAGIPMEAGPLARVWAEEGGISSGDARDLATEYVRALHRGLLSIDGFREILEAGATVLSAEQLRKLVQGMQTNDEIEIALTYYRAADRYVDAALARLAGDEEEVATCRYRANSLIEEAELARDWRVIESLEGLRVMFAEMVECGFDEFLAKVVDSDQVTAEAALQDFTMMCTDFKAAVRDRF
jgi:hypothetical protein